jgi:glycosyltransferase involved in cell wall biosynthesis
MQLIHALGIGGSEKLTKYIALELSKRGIEISVCALDEGGVMADELKKMGIPVYVKHRKPGLDIGLMRRFASFFMQEKVDFVITHHFNQLFYSIMGAKLARVPILHVEHERYSLQNWKNAIIAGLVFRGCFRVLALGLDVQEFLVNRLMLPRWKVECVRGCVLPMEVTHFRHRDFGMNIGKKDIVVTCVARLEPKKNHKMLIKGVYEARKNLKTIKLLIVGDGSQRHELERTVDSLGLEGSVFFLGALRDIWEILNITDIFALCSDEEGTPLAILEAMAAGKPVVATAVGNVPSILGGGLAGILINRGDYQALANAILQLSHDKEYAIKLGVMGQRIVQEQYSGTNFINTIETLCYKGIIRYGQ